MKQQSFKRQIPLNLISNLGLFILNIVINFLLTPFYINHIGLEGLGIVRLAVTIPVFAGLASIIISGSVSRFLTIDIQKNDYESANQNFNTAFYSLFAILIALIPAIIIFSYNVSAIFYIPHQFQNQVILLFLGILLNSSILVFSAIFIVPAYANNRLDIINYVNTITLITQTFIIVYFINFINSNLSYIGLGYFAGALTNFILSIIIWKKFAPDMILNRLHFRFSKLKELSLMGGWNFLNQIGMLLFLYIDLIVINRFFGAEQTGKYSVILQWTVLLRSLSSVLANVISPMIFISYANKQINKVINISKHAVKFLGLTLAIPIGLLAGFSSSLLSLWVGKAFTEVTPLMWVMLSHLTINLSMIPLFSISSAFNKVKIPALVTLAMGGVNLTLAILFSVYLDFGIYGVAFASAIALTLKNTFFTPIYAAKILGISFISFLKPMFNNMLLACFVFYISYTTQLKFLINSWYELIILSLTISLIIIFLIWCVMLTKDDKELLLELLPFKVPF